MVAIHGGRGTTKHRGDVDGVPFREEPLDEGKAPPFGWIGGLGGRLGEGGGSVFAAAVVVGGEGLEDVSNGAASPLPYEPGPCGRLSGAMVRRFMPLTGGETFVFRSTGSCMPCF